MKTYKYQIIKNGNMFGVASKKDIQAYNKTHFLPVELFMHRKNELIYVIENNEHYRKLKGNTDYKTVEIY